MAYGLYRPFGLAAGAAGAAAAAAAAGAGPAAAPTAGAAPAAAALAASPLVPATEAAAPVAVEEDPVEQGLLLVTVVPSGEEDSGKKWNTKVC